MSVKTAGVGHIQLPAAPAAGVSITSGAANTYTTTAIAIGTTPSAVYVTGIHVEAAAAMAATYISVQLMVGASAIGQYLVPLTTGSTVALGFRPIFPPIPVATATSITAKTADSVGSKATLVSLEIIAQSNVVDDGITVGTVNLTNTVTTYTGNTVQTGDSFAVVKSGGTGDNAAIKTKTDFLPSATAGAAGGVQIAGANAATTYATLTSTGAFTVNGVSAVSQTGDAFASLGASGAGLTALGDTRIAHLDADVSSRMATYAQPTGFLAATFPTTVASTTNITAGTIATVTTLTNLPSIPANWLTAAGIAATALNGKGDWPVGKTGYSISGIKTTLDALNDIAATAIVSAGAITTSAGKVSGVILADTVTTYTGNTPQTGDAFARVGLAGVGLTNLGDARVANLDATVSSRLASASYTAPDNAGIAAIESLTAAALDATISSRLAASSYVLPPSATDNAAAAWSYAIEGAYTAQQYAQWTAAALFGNLSGVSSNSLNFKSPANAATTRITATPAADGRTVTALI